MPSPMFMSPPIPSRPYAPARFRTLVAERPTSLATSTQRSPAMTRPAALALTSSVYGGGGTATMPRIPGHPVRQAPLGRVPQLGDHLLQRHASPEAHVDGFPPLRLAEHSGLQSGHSRVQLFVRIPNLAPKMRRPSQIERRITNLR